jgi:hypothetical protein
VTTSDNNRYDAAIKSALTAGGATKTGHKKTTPKATAPKATTSAKKEESDDSKKLRFARN